MCKKGEAAAVWTSLPAQLFVDGGSAWCKLPVSVISGTKTRGKYFKLFYIGHVEHLAINPRNEPLRDHKGFSRFDRTFGEGWVMSLCAHLDTCGTRYVTFRKSATCIKETFWRQGKMNTGSVFWYFKARSADVLMIWWYTRRDTRTVGSRRLKKT